MKINTLSAKTISKMSMKAFCLGVSLLGLAFHSSAETLKARIPFDFTAGAKALPAGDYLFSVETSGILLVSGMAGTPGSVMTAVLAETASAQPSAAFEKTAGTAVLSRVTLQNGVTYLLPAMKHASKLLPTAQAGVLMTRQ
ncbi:MAG: hypothetical protein ABL967_14195 [Bryobacteraceae bacterium]